MSSDSEEESLNQDSNQVLTQTRRNISRKNKELEAKIAQARIEMIVENNIQKAQSILDNIISQDPRYQKAYINYGNLWNSKGDYTKAIHHYTIATKIKTTPKLWKKIAFLEKTQAQKCDKSQQHEAALQHYYQAAKYLGKLLRQRNKIPNIHLMQERVDCLERCLEYEKGIKQLQVLVEIAKNLDEQRLLQESVKRIARLYVKKNQLQEAKIVLKSIPLSDKSMIMLCEILEKEENLIEMREVLDNYFGCKNMKSILQIHHHKLICFYIQSLQQSFTDYQQIVDYYINNYQGQQQELACKTILDLTDKLTQHSKLQLLQVMYNYRDQLNQQLRSDILTKYNTYSQDAQEILEEPQIPAQPNTKDQILFLYKKLKQTNDILEKFELLKKSLILEEKSINKLRYFNEINREDYEQLFGRKHKKRRLRKFHQFQNSNKKKTTTLSKEIGPQNFFNIILEVSEGLLENIKSQELFKLTRNVYQLRLKKISNDNFQQCEEFIKKLAQYGLWASLKEKKFRYAPIYLRYITEDNLILYLIQIIDQNVQTKLRGIFNSFTRNLPYYQQSVLPYKLDQLIKLQEQEPKNPLYNLLISVKYLQEMTGRLAIDQEKLLQKSLYYFDCYRSCQPDPLEVKYNLARVYLHINVVNKGMEILEEILDHNEEHPIKSKAGFALMQIHKKLGNQEQAFYYLKKYNTFQ